MSRHLKHPNVVPLLGVFVDTFELITDFMPGGDLTGHIATHPNVDRRSLVCFTPPQCATPDLLSSYPTLPRVSVTCIPTTWFMETSREYVAAPDFVPLIC